jgi:sulfur carrier protein ThiS
MSVKVVSALLLPYSRNQTVEVDGCTIGESLSNLALQIPGIKEQLFDKTGSLRDYFHVYVNKSIVSSNVAAKPTQDGDEIHLVVMITGG